MSTQTDPNAEYNTKVREIAEEIGFILFLKDTIFMEGTDHDDKRSFYNNCVREERATEARYVKRNIDVALAMVERMERSFIEGYKAALVQVDKLHPTFSVSCNKELKGRGLIPNTKTTDNA